MALETALQCRPNLTIIGEEVEKNQTSLKEIVDDICELVISRYEAKKNYGVIVIPEGLIEFIPEFRLLLSELNRQTENFSVDMLSSASRRVFESLPPQVAEKLSLDRDPHGNVQVAKISTEEFFN